MKERIAELRKEVDDFQISGADALEQFRIAYLSKKGQISALFEGFRNVSPGGKEGDRAAAERPEAVCHG